MRLTRIRLVRAALIIAACVLLPDVGRPDDTPPAPPPRAVKGKEPAAPQPGKPPVAPPNEWAAKFAGRTPDEILAVLNQFAQDGVVRRGGYEVARLRLSEAVSEAPQVRAKVGALSPPAALIPLVAHRPADVEAGIRTAQQLADYHAARVQLLDGTAGARAALDARSREFDRAAAAARDHLAAMSAAARAAELVLGDRLPPTIDPKQLAEEAAQLRTASAAAADEAKKAQALLGATEKELADARAAAAAAVAKLNELRAAREVALEAFAFEEKVREMTTPILTEEFNRLRKLFAEKTAAIKGDTDDYAKAGPAAAEARAKLHALREPAAPPDPAPGATPPALDAVGQKLVTAQQYLAARVRAVDERAEKVAALVAALDELEKKGLAYSTTLEDARRIGAHLAATGAELERRVGRGDLKATEAPDVAEAAGTAGSRAKLDADAAAVQKTLGDLRAERDALRKPDTEAENRKALTVVLLGRVNERIDLLTDLKRLAAEYATARKDRSDGEQKRMDQRAAERMAREAEPWSRFFALDHSRAATDLSDLLSAYYKELIDLDEKGENLDHQKERLNKLIELTRKQTEDVAKLRTLLEKLRARPETAPWDGWLAGQLAPGGLKAEADVYHDEGARLAAVGGANGRRVAALTGNPPPEKPKSAADQTQLAATGGEIGQARAELLEARARGLIVTGVKIGATLLAALLVPPVLMFVLRRAIRGGTDAAGNLSPVLAALRGVLKIGTWIAAAALVLSVLGYDVTALVGGLAIGVLAIALAARPMIADVLGSVVIFAERRFQAGDVVRLGGGEPARVVGLTWRSTALKTPAGQVVSIPNRKVTEGTVENLSRGTETYDTLAVTISTDKDAGRVVGVIRAALAQCKNLSPTDQGVTVLKFNQKGPVKVVEYRFWWFLKDYEVRNKTRDEVFARIAVGLAHEDMTGIEVTLA